MMANRFAVPAGEYPQFLSTLSFLEGRLAQRGTFEWALGLTSQRMAERHAVLEALDRFPPKEPWLTAWRLVEEAWNEERAPGASDEVRVLELARELRQGNLSGALASKIVERVRPRLSISALSPLNHELGKVPAKPRSWRHLLSAKLTSGRVFDPSELGLAHMRSERFLRELLGRLEDALQHGIDIGIRLGWTPKIGFWRLGGLDRVYFVPSEETGEDRHEPDEFHNGIAACSKLLFAVSQQLSAISPNSAKKIVRRWGATDSAVHRRLWCAAAARLPQLVPAPEVGSYLAKAPVDEFWNPQSYPEIAEVRARRFAELSVQHRDKILQRLLKGPPRSYWAREPDKTKVENYRRHWAARELRRIDQAGGPLNRQASRLLEEDRKQFPDLEGQRPDAGFMATQRAQAVGSNPDPKYDALRGRMRLEALQAAISTENRSWENDPAQMAYAWIREARNADEVLGDFEADGGGPDFSTVWEAFGHYHQLPAIAEGESQADFERRAQALAQRVVNVVLNLPNNLIGESIEGLTSWFQRWEKIVAHIPEKDAAWFRVWPLAVELTNAQQPENAPVELNIKVRTRGDHEPNDLDTLNTPAGRMVGVFLVSCPNLGDVAHPFAENEGLRAMRDAIVAAPGRSGLIGLHRLIESLAYFLRADPGWTQKELIEPLQGDSDQALALWRALGRSHLNKDVIIELSAQIVDRATDRRLGRETRQRLVFHLLVENLFSFWEDREPAIARDKVTQMLRRLDDEVRAFAADVVRRFISDLINSNGDEGYSAENLFLRAGKPFLDQVWPKERGATTPGVAKAFAHLPAVCGEEFAAAVRLILPFLVPFETWSMLDYGLYGDFGDKPRLSLIDNKAKAEALLLMMDSTIGLAEGSIVPMDLGTAMERIAGVSPSSTSTQEYRRLAALARR